MAVDDAVGAPKGPRGQRPATDEADLSHRQIMVILSALMAASFLAGLDQTILQTAIPSIAGEFGGASRIGWLAIAYLLTSTIATPLFGKISDLYGRKRLLHLAIVIFLVGSVGSALSQDMGQLIGARAIQGIGGGGLIALPMAVMGDIVSPARRGRYTGYMGITYALAAVFGPLIGGFFVDNASWHWCFWLNIPVGLAAMAVVQRQLQVDHRRNDRAVDWMGALLLTVSVTPLLLAVAWSGQDHGWDSPWTIAQFAIGGVALGAFVAREAHAPEPILPLRVFSSSVMRVLVIGTFVVGGATFGATLFIPLFLQVVAGVSATNSGLLVLPLMFGTVPASMATGRRVARTGRYKAYPIWGLGLMTAGFVMLTTLDADAHPWQVIAPMFVIGVGMGTFSPVATLAGQNAVDYRDLGIATSVIHFFRSLGGTFGAALFNAVFANRLVHELDHFVPPAERAGLPDPEVLQGSPKTIEALPPAVHRGVEVAFSNAIHTVFVVAIPVCLAAFVLMWFLREEPLRTTVGSDATPAATGEDSPVHSV
jgi:EmrB/QacA subfamily drug resistance transporter